MKHIIHEANNNSSRMKNKSFSLTKMSSFFISHLSCKQQNEIDKLMQYNVLVKNQ